MRREEKQRTRAATAPGKNLTDRLLAANEERPTAQEAEVRGGLRGCGMENQWYCDFEI